MSNENELKHQLKLALQNEIKAILGGGNNEITPYKERKISQAVSMYHKLLEESK